MLHLACERLVELDDLRCPCELYGLAGEEIDSVLDSASDILVLMTHLPLGRCENALRPCQPCRRCPSDPCGCCVASGVPIKGVDPEIIEVLIDGEVVDPNSYALIRNSLGDTVLMRFDPDTGQFLNWPGCQRLHLDSDQPKTFEVKVRTGVEPDTLVRLAAAEIACDLFSALAGDRTKLPDGVVSASVYGLDISLVATSDELRNAASGFTWVTKLRQIHPPSLPADLWSPELDDGWQLSRHL